MENDATHRKLYERILREVKERNYAAVPFALSHEELSSAAEQYLGFLKIDQPTKEKFYCVLDHKDDASQIGYVRRKQEELSYGTLDDKEYFHFNEHADEKFAPLLTGGVEVASFWSQAKKIYVAARSAFAEIMYAMETEFPGIYHEFFPPGKRPKFYLRFLKYNVRGLGGTLARGHYDRGGFTLALAESDPGLRMGKNDKNLKEVEHKRGHAIFMPALKAPKITSPEFHPTWHDVIQKREVKPGEETARWAIVFFADPYNMEPVSAVETHTPIAT